MQLLFFLSGKVSLFACNREIYSLLYCKKATFYLHALVILIALLDFSEREKTYCTKTVHSTEWSIKGVYCRYLISLPFTKKEKNKTKHCFLY